MIDRFAQIEPKVLLAIDGYRYGGRDFDRRAVVEEIAGAIPSLERVVRLGLSGRLRLGGRVPWLDRDAEFAPVPFDHPLWVLYSSGTTGLPKPIVHSQGGILLEQLKKLHLHLDAQAGDRAVLVLDDRLDDVELRRRRAADRRVDRAVRRQPGLPGPRARCGSWRPTRG